MWNWISKLKEEDVLFCIICGPEQSGTTMLSSLICQHPDIDGRFEIGFYMNECLAEFKYEAEGRWVEHLQRRWGLSDKDVSYILTAKNHQQAYVRLKKTIKN